LLDKRVLVSLGFIFYRSLQVLKGSGLVVRDGDDGVASAARSNHVAFVRWNSTGVRKEWGRIAVLVAEEVREEA